MKDNKHKYQIVVVLDPKSEKKDKVLETVYAKIEAMSAEVTKKDGMGLKDFVYQIKGQDKGDFWNLEVESDKPLKIGEFNLFLNRNTNILRYLILKV